MPGTLTYRPEAGLALELIGGWDPEIKEEVGSGVFDVREGSRRWDLLHGLAENREIALLDCLPTHTLTRNFGPPKEQTIHVLTALSGVHLSTAGQALFTECHVAVEDLTAWSNSSVLSGTREIVDGRPNGTGSFVAKPVKDPSVTVIGVVTSLTHEHTLPFFERARDGTLGTMRETRFVRFQPAEPWSVTNAQEHAKMVQDLLSLALYRSCGLLWIRLKMPPEEHDYPEGYPIRDRQVGLYTKHTVQAEPSAKALEHHQALFTCEHMPFEEIWPQWCQVRERCLRASNMILRLC